MRKMMKLEDKRCAEFQDIESMKTLIKVQGQQLAEFQNAMDSAKNMMKTENKCYTKFWDDMYSMKMALEGTPSMPMK